ncbi:MAG: ABC transporter ATP-binding protein [Pseudomonadota bacterium]
MIEVRGVHKTFHVGDEDVRALVDINLDIVPGEYISVMGPSGSGKSTLLNMLGLLDRPERGEYRIDGIDTVALREEQRADIRRRRIGFVFQAYHLVPRLTARENVELPLTLGGVPPAQRRIAVDDIMRRLDILDRGTHVPAQLSGGQRQRVAIARAIVMRPEILLADEPTGNLDSKSGEDMIRVLEQLNDAGITLLIVTHDAVLGARAKRRIHMLDGRIATDERS